MTGQNRDMEDKAAIIAHVCEILSSGNHVGASEVIKKQYPFEPITKVKGGFNASEATKVFVRDGFVDRYRKDRPRLIYPPALRLISSFLPEEFPYHKNGAHDKGHFAYWELFPTVDHIVPRARGGSHDESNWICCSLMTNQIKSNWTLEELEWNKYEPGDFAQWDGMLNWFVREMSKDGVRSSAPTYCRVWLGAAKRFAS